jgi:dGTPase
VALDYLARDIGGFEGNAQTLRLLTRLEAKATHPDRRPAGLNLTRASLDASTKYPWPRHGQERMKFGVYVDDMDVFSWLRKGAPDDRLCLEAQVMDFADDVAYCVHDVEDAVVAGWLDLGKPLDSRTERKRIGELAREWYLNDVEADEIIEALDRLRALPFWVPDYDGLRPSLAALKDLTSQMIGRFTEAAQQATHAVYGRGQLTRYDADLEVPRSTRTEIGVLKGLVAVYVMTDRDRAPIYTEQRSLIDDLVELMRASAPASLEPMFRADFQDAGDDAGRLRAVVDQVASLTDASAYVLRERLAAPR